MIKVTIFNPRFGEEGKTQSFSTYEELYEFLSPNLSFEWECVGRYTWLGSGRGGVLDARQCVYVNQALSFEADED